ncbi:MAG: GLUG motif-containing protein [Planctomycetota bacterium]|jgi:hypothetical protein
MCKIGLRRGLILITVLALHSAAFSAEFAGGTGEAEDPYRITTAEQLVSIGSDATMMDKHFVLVNDIDLSGSEWRPIGARRPDEFDGVFDGNNHVVFNPSTTSPDGLERSGSSLFAATGERAIIRNLILENSEVIPAPGNAPAGALVDRNRGTIKNCSVQATLTGTYCGGLAGRNTGLILYCDVTCSISADSGERPPFAGTYCGGLAGRNWGLILYCDVTCSISSESGVRHAGCLVGENRAGSIFASKATGSITCGHDSEYVGGLVGASLPDGCVIACSADVNITCGDKSERVGGLVGWNWRTVVAESYVSGVLITGAECKEIGGLVGENGSAVLNCYASGAVVAGDETVEPGGLVGVLGPGSRVADSYFLAAADGGGPNNGIGTELRDSQMRQQSSFAGWDFTASIQDGMKDFWAMPADGGYPVLGILGASEPSVLPGAGSADDPYLLNTAEQLGFVARNPDACYRLVADLDPGGIKLGGAAVPLFCGNFDGSGLAVRNLTMAGGGYLGLFGTISRNAAVTDLYVVDAQIDGSDTSRAVAVLAAKNNGTIARCAVTGMVEGEGLVGGLVGDNEGRIHDCYATCSVTGAWSVGGLVGENNWVIRNSYVNGQVSSLGDEGRAGALVGYHFAGIIVNCFWERRDGTEIPGDACLGLTPGQLKDGAFLGLNGWAENPSWVIDSGIDYPRLIWEGTSGEPIPAPSIDWLSGGGTRESPHEIGTVEQLKLLSIASVLWDEHFVLTADLDCTGNEFGRIGICPGTGFGGNFDGAYHRIANLNLGPDAALRRYVGLFGYVDSGGSISRLIMDNVRVSCGPLSGPVAALAGENNGSIEDCGATGSVDCGRASWAVGGLIGSNRGTTGSCYADVTVSIGDDGGVAGAFVGGNYGRISNSYSLGSVYCGLSARRLGGFAGITHDQLIHCYSTGVIGARDDSGFSYNEVGRFAGYAPYNSLIVSCYFLGPDNHLGTGLSEEQMRKRESFIGWDFVGETANGTEDIWRILEGQEYPRLQWEPAN